MADIQITKMIVLRGQSIDLPPDLDSGELAFSTDEGRLFIGCDPATGQPQYDRTDFPFRNIEILTENSTDLFAKLHGDRMREGGGHDYYDVRLEANTNSWAAVQVDRSGEMVDYRLEDVTTVNALIDYSVVGQDSVPYRMGTMMLSYSSSTPAEPQLTHNGMMARDPTLIDSMNYDPVEVFQLINFRFRVAGPISAPFLVFQYTNYGSEVLNLRFKVSRPEATFYDSAPTGINITPAI